MPRVCDLLDAMRYMWKDLVSFKTADCGRAQILFNCIHALLSLQLQGLISRSLQHLFQMLDVYKVSNLCHLSSSFTPLGWLVAWRYSGTSPKSHIYFSSILMKLVGNAPLPPSPDPINIIRGLSTFSGLFTGWQFPKRIQSGQSEAATPAIHDAIG